MAKINLSPINNLQNESTVTATINNNNTIIAAAVENSISRDGTQPNNMNSRLDMNSNEIINLPDATTDQEPVTYGQYLDGITSIGNGAVVAGDFVVLAHNDTMLNDRVLAAGTNIEVVDGGAKGNVEVRVNNDQLNAIALTTSAADKLPYFTGEGTADVTDFTAFSRTLLDDADASTMRDTLGLTLGIDTQPHTALLDSLNDSGIGIIAKTGVDTIAPRTITGTSNEITVVDGDGTAGDPTISLPNSLTFTGKSVTGGSFSSPSITTPTGIVKADVGLGNVDNTSDATKNAAAVTLTNKTLTAPIINSPTGIVKADVGLSNVDNTSDANKPVSTATQTALDAKVAGPASAINGRIPIFSGTTGKVIADGGHVLPTGSVVGHNDVQTLTNKTINGPDNTITNIANASLASTADSTIKSNVSGGSATPSDNTITSVLDKQLGTAQGSVAYRGPSIWTSIGPGTSGNFLQTQGAAANPQWAAIPGGGDMLSTNNLSDVASATTSRANLGISDTLPTRQIFTSGSGTYTSPAGCRWIRIRMVGGGGGGCGANAAGGQTDVGSAGGGAGYVEHIMAAGSYSYVVGAGGAAQTNGTNSTFNAGALVASAGGGTTFNSGAGTTPSRSSATGVGGSASGGNVANIPGSHGEFAFRYSGSELITARGGSSFMSNEGIMLASGASAGLSYGGGGGGAGSVGSGAVTGGAGAAGIIIVEEYYR